MSGRRRRWARLRSSSRRRSTYARESAVTSVATGGGSVAAVRRVSARIRSDVLLTREDRVLRVTINRPGKHVQLSRAILAELQAVFDSARDEPDLACAVLTGAGDKYFAAGGDLRDLAKVRTEQGVCAMVEESRAALDAVRLSPGNWPMPPFDDRRAIEQRQFVKTWKHEGHWFAVDRFLSSKA